MVHIEPCCRVCLIHIARRYQQSQYGRWRMSYRRRFAQTECWTWYETVAFTVLIIVLIEVVRMVCTWYDMGTVYVPIVEGEVAVALDRNGTLASAAQLLSIEDVAAVISDVATRFIFFMKQSMYRT